MTSCAVPQCSSPERHAGLRGGRAGQPRMNLVATAPLFAALPATGVPAFVRVNNVAGTT